MITINRQMSKLSKQEPSTRRNRRQAAGKFKTHEDYLVTLSPDKRTALEKLRRAIKAAAPEADECVSYGIPAFRLNGKLLVFYGAGKDHCAFYPGSTIQQRKADLRTYDTSKGTIRFSPDQPLPAALVRRLVKLRIAERSIR
jgi:uncharacterized protein YdhG (YjbR/CyaY superfamily)